MGKISDRSLLTFLQPSAQPRKKAVYYIKTTRHISEEPILVTRLTYCYALPMHTHLFFTELNTYLHPFLRQLSIRYDLCLTKITL